MKSTAKRRPALTCLFPKDIVFIFSIERPQQPQQLMHCVNLEKQKVIHNGKNL